MDKNLNYYKLNNNYFLSYLDYDNMTKITEQEIQNKEGTIYFLNQLSPLNSRRSFSVSDPSLLFLKEEGLNLLKLSKGNYISNIPSWILDKIENNELTSINTNYPDWMNVLEKTSNKKWRVNLIALGDVGSNVLIGLNRF